VVSWCGTLLERSPASVTVCKLPVARPCNTQPPGARPGPRQAEVRIFTPHLISKQNNGGSDTAITLAATRPPPFPSSGPARTSPGSDHSTLHVWIDEHPAAVPLLAARRGHHCAVVGASNPFKLQGSVAQDRVWAGAGRAWAGVFKQIHGPPLADLAKKHKGSTTLVKVRQWRVTLGHTARPLTGAPLVLGERPLARPIWLSIIKMYGRTLHRDHRDP